MTRPVIHAPLWPLFSSAIASERMSGTNLSRIYRRIQWAKSFPNIAARFQMSFVDHNTNRVTLFPENHSKLQIVSSIPDRKIQIVDCFTDFTMKYVESVQR